MYHIFHGLSRLQGSGSGASLSHDPSRHEGSRGTGSGALSDVWVVLDSGCVPAVAADVCERTQSVPVVLVGWCVSAVAANVC